MNNDLIHPMADEEEREAAREADQVWIVLLTCRDSRVNHGPGCVPCDSFMTGPLVYFLEITA